MAYRMRFSNTVTVEPKVSENASHKITYGSPVTKKCAYQESVLDSKVFAGKEIIALAWIAFPPSTVIGFDDRITLPDGTHPPIVSIASRRNDVTKKVVYIEVYLAKVGGS